jgi:hypothetical protein
MPLFPYHYQDCEEDCGPACLLMMLESRGIPPNHWLQSTLLSLAQTVCDPSGHSGCSYLASPPNGLASAANAALSIYPAQSLQYEVFPVQTPPNPPPSDQEIVERIIRSLDEEGAPVFLLVDSGRHWIAVHGWRKIDDVRFFDFRSPYQGLSCSYLRLHDTGCIWCGNPDVEVLPENGLLARLTPVTHGGTGTWGGQRVIVAPVLRSGVLTVAMPAPPTGLRV